MATEPTAKTGPSHDQLLELVANLQDDQAAEILRSGASLQEIEEAVGWATGLSGVMGELRRPLSGRAALVYDILTEDRAPSSPERE